MNGYQSVLRCKCWQCLPGKHSRIDCIMQKCNCCDLEDMLVMVSHTESEREITLPFMADDMIN